MYLGHIQNVRKIEYEKEKKINFTTYYECYVWHILIQEGKVNRNWILQIGPSSKTTIHSNWGYVAIEKCEDRPKITHHLSLEVTNKLLGTMMWI